MAEWADSEYSSDEDRYCELLETESNLSVFDSLYEGGDTHSDSLYMWIRQLLKDPKTEIYVKFAKVMLIFQSPCFGDRNRVVSSLTEKFGILCSEISDSYYAEETRKCFSPEKVEEFYEYCRKKCLDSCQRGDNLIIINQSMSDVRQRKYYSWLAQEMQYVSLIVPPLFTNVKKDSRIKNFANSFSSSLAVHLEHNNWYEHQLCGWFLHGIDSAELRDEASLYIEDCFRNIPDFSSFFSRAFTFKNFRSYYNMIDSRKQDLAFCIVKVIDSKMDVLDYLKNECVRNLYGKVSRLIIVGFIISPYIVAARVKLTHKQNQVWAMRKIREDADKISLYPSDIREKAKVSLDSIQLRTPVKNCQPTIKTEEYIPKNKKVNFGNIKLRSPVNKCRRTIKTEEYCENPTEVFKSKILTKSCHILLGKASNAPLRYVNYDVQFAADREEKSFKQNSEGLCLYDSGRSLVMRNGKYWYIYLKEHLSVEGFFATCSIPKDD